MKFFFISLCRRKQVFIEKLTQIILILENFSKTQATSDPAGSEFVTFNRSQSNQAVQIVGICNTA